MLVSVGGIKLSSLRGLPRFLFHALRTLRAARAAKGCLHANIFRKGDLFIALSVWDDHASMKAFAHSGPHPQAIRKTRKYIASSVNHLEEASAIPTQEQAWDIWQMGESRKKA